MSGDNQDAGVISVETLYIHLAQYYQQDRDSGNESDQSLNMILKFMRFARHDVRLYLPLGKMAWKVLKYAAERSGEVFLLYNAALRSLHRLAAEGSVRSMDVVKNDLDESVCPDVQDVQDVQMQDVASSSTYVIGRSILVDAVRSLENVLSLVPEERRDIFCEMLRKGYTAID